MSPHLIAVLQALFVAFLWATSWVFIKIGLHTLPPLTFAGLRYFIAFVCLLFILLSGKSKAGITGLPGRVWVRLIVLGCLFYAGTQGASFVALAYLPAVTVNFLWSFSTITVALLGMVFLAERPTIFQWGGISLAFTGALLYFFPISIPETQIFGVIVMLAGIIAHAISLIVGRDINRSKKYPPLMVTVISMGAGSIVLLVTGLGLEPLPAIDAQSWAIIVWLALVNTAFAFTLMNHTLRTLTAMEASIINSTMLIWIPIFAVIFLGESISVNEIIGLSLAIMGTLIVQLRRLPGGKKDAN